MTRDGQFTVQLPDGIVIERLPVGLAGGKWYFVFVVTGQFDPQQVARPEFIDEWRQAFDVTAIEGERLTPRGWGGGGDLSSQRVDKTYVYTGPQRVRVTYNYGGQERASETLHLSE